MFFILLTLTSDYKHIPFGESQSAEECGRTKSTFLDCITNKHSKSARKFTLVPIYKEWKKFGAAENDPQGVNSATTVISDECFMQFLSNKEEAEKVETSALSISTVKCRYCKGDHWSAKCPHKDLLEGRMSADTSAKGKHSFVFIVPDVLLKHSNLISKFNLHRWPIGLVELDGLQAAIDAQRSGPSRVQVQVRHGHGQGTVVQE